MTELWLRKVGTALFPDGDESIAVFDRLPSQKPLHCDVKRPRHLEHHRLYFKLLHRVADYLSDDSITTEVLHILFKLNAGIYTLVQLPNGDLHKHVGSIAWSKMNQDAFHTFFEKTVAYIYGPLRIPPGVVADLLVKDREPQPR